MYSFPNFEPVSCPMSSSNCFFWPAYRFLRRQVRGSGIPVSFRIFRSLLIHTVRGFLVVNEAEVDVFLEFPCFLYDPMNVDNLISGSSAFSKWSEVKSLSRVWLFATPWTVAHQAPPSMGFPRQEYWSGLLTKLRWQSLVNEGISLGMF